VYKRANWGGIKTDLKDIYDSLLLNCNAMSVNEMWCYFKTNLINSMKTFIPEKTLKTNMRLPWVTPALQRLISRRKRAYRAARHSRNPRLLEKANDLKHFLQKEMRKSYWNYINNLFQIDPELPDDKQTKQKRFFQYVNSLKKEGTSLPPLQVNGNTVSNSKHKATVFNNFFSSVFTIEPESELPNMGPSPYPAMDDPIISEAGILKLLLAIQPNKAHGPDQIPARVMKENAVELAPILALIFNSSLSRSEVPEDWRTGNVSPIYKKGQKQDPCNYRPVSLTCIACKLMEHVIVSNIMKFADANNIIHCNQHGFRKRLSCDTQLVELVHDIASSLDVRHQVDMLIMDFCKAFDKVPHKRLLHKLNWFGIKGNTLTWIQSFLACRKQQVIIDGEPSDQAEVTSGVPQGSVLGPCLFLLYINDLPNCIMHSKIRLFADDCVIYRDIASKEDADLLQDDLTRVQQWEQQWLMKFNVDKCNVMHFSHARNNTHYDYLLHNTPLSSVSETKYLGVTITSDLSWRSHITKTVAGASKTLNFVNRNLRLASTDTKLTAFTSLIRPKLEYAASVWDPHHKNHVHSLERVQNRAIRSALSNWDRGSSITNMRSQLKLNTLEHRRNVSRLTLFYKCMNSHVSIKIPFSANTRPSRKNNRNFKVPFAKKDCLKYSFFIRAVTEWNQLPQNIVNSETINRFKSAVNQYYVHNML
jgi:hypothetical protein